MVWVSPEFVAHGRGFVNSDADRFFTSGSFAGYWLYGTRFLDYKHRFDLGNPHWALID
jgi:hypothetical protein